MFVEIPFICDSFVFQFIALFALSFLFFLNELVNLFALDGIIY